MVDISGLDPETGTWDNWFSVHIPDYVDAEGCRTGMAGQGRTFQEAVENCRSGAEQFAPGLHTYVEPAPNEFTECATVIVNTKRDLLTVLNRMNLVDITEVDNECHTVVFSMLPEMTFSGHTFEVALRAAELFLGRVVSCEPNSDSLKLISKASSDET